VDENQLTIDSFAVETEPEKAEETPVEVAPVVEKVEKAKNHEKEKQKAQKRVRSMFDLITFDNV
jgi:hypothetical protein